MSDSLSPIICGEQLQRLRKMLGSKVLQLYTTHIDVELDCLSMPHVSIPCGEDYLVVETDWADTPKHFIDYHEWSITLETAPKGITVAGWRGHTVLGPCSAIRLAQRDCRIGRISVFDYSEEYSDESVHYDAGIVFTLDGEQEFLLAAQESIAGQLEYTRSTEQIRAFKSAYRCRIVLQ